MNRHGALEEARIWTLFCIICIGNITPPCFAIPTTSRVVPIMFSTYHTCIAAAPVVHTYFISPRNPR